MSTYRLAAVLFTDIVGFTKAMEENREWTAEMLQRHDAALNVWVPAHGGEVVNRMGDGSFCLFASVTDAVRCAIAIQNELQKQTPVPLKIGVNSGEVSYEGGQAVGDAVNLAARIVSMGQAGTILLSARAEQEIKNEPALCARYEGDFCFKNVRQPIGIYAMKVAGLPEFDANKVKEEYRCGEAQLSTPVPGILRVYQAAVAWLRQSRKHRAVGWGVLIVLAAPVVFRSLQLLTTPPAERYMVDQFACAGLDSAECRWFSRTTFEMLEKIRPFVDRPYKMVDQEEAKLASFLDLRRRRFDRVVSGTVTRSEGLITGSLVIRGRSRFGEVRDSYSLSAGTLRQLRWDIFDRLARHLKVGISQEERMELLGGPTTDEAFQHYVQGRRKLDRSDHRDSVLVAIRRFRASAAADSNFAYAYSGLCAAYQILWGMTKERANVLLAKEACTRARQLDGKYARIRSDLASFYSTIDSLEAAEQEFIWALEIDSLLFDARVGLADVYRKQKRTDRAEAMLSSVIRSDPRSWKARDNLGHFLYREVRYDEAIAVWETAVDLRPENIKLWAQLGAGYVLSGRYDEAAGAFRRSIDLKPTSPAFNNLGTAYFFKGDFPAARAAYESALAHNPASALARVNLANVMTYLPEFADATADAWANALEAVEAQLRVSRLDGRAAYLRALCLRGLGREGEAESVLDSLAESSPDRENLRRIGILYARMGVHDKALATIERALSSGVRRDDFHPDFAAYPELRPLREDPRYGALLTDTQ